MQAIKRGLSLGTTAAALVAATPTLAQIGTPAAPPLPATGSTPASPPANAQPDATVAGQAPPAPAAGGLAEIVVTAQRRGEKLQDTPITVSAITGELAAAKGVYGTSDLQIVTPGLVFADSGSGPAVYLRGVGTQNTAPGDEGSVSTYVDGVYQSSLPAAFSSLANVERVETLKGPQGTLFGRNATGGLINIITRDPSFTPGLEASINVGSYSDIGGELYATAPITDKIAFNASFYGNDQLDGWGKNVATGQDVYNEREYASRVKLLWQPSSDTRIVLAGDYSYSLDTSTSGTLDRGAIGLGGNAGLPNFFDVNDSLPPLEINKNYGVSLHAQQDLSFARLVNIVAYREDRYASDFDNDRGPLQIVDAYIRFHDKQFTEEFQVQSLPSSRIKWIGGVYYLHNTTDLTAFDLVGLGLAAAGGSYNTPAQQKTNSIAGYAQVTVPLGSRTNVTGGLRYTDDHRDLTSYSLLGFGITLPGTPQSSHYDRLTYRASIDHHFTPDVMVFASYNRGFKSGVFNLFAPSDPSTRPEQLDAYEVGVKSEFFNHRLRVNVSPFLYKYKDIQLVQAYIDGTRLLNAARATTKGIDADASAVIVPGLTLDASIEYLHARYDSFPGAPSALPAPATCTPVPMQLPGPPTGGNINCTIDASGNQLIRAPDFSGTVGLSYQWRTALGKMQANANLFHSSSFPYEASNRLKQPSYELLNAQVGWTSLDDRFGVRLFARNLLDKHYFTNRVSAGADTYAAAAPRTVGAQFSVKM